MYTQVTSVDRSLLMTEDLLFVLRRYHAEDVNPFNLELNQYLKQEPRFFPESLSDPVLAAYLMAVRDFEMAASLGYDDFNVRVFLLFKVVYGFKMFQVNILDSSTDISIYQIKDIYDRIMSFDSNYFRGSNKLYEDVQLEISRIFSIEDYSRIPKEKELLFLRVANEHPEFEQLLRDTYLNMKIKVRGLFKEILSDKRTIELAADKIFFQKIVNLLDIKEDQEFIKGLYLNQINEAKVKDKKRYNELCSSFKQFNKNHLKDESYDSMFEKSPKIIALKQLRGNKYELNMTYTEFANLIIFATRKRLVSFCRETPHKKISHGLYDKFKLSKKGENSSVSSFDVIYQRAYYSEEIPEPVCSNEIIQEVVNIVNTMPFAINN